ncbi:MAG: thioredoxin family protein [Staphylococcus rostri]|uniref:thioredoxin family protein n=1 Tax=Staphylococcus rostri TaxID=522262 RepID=UPI0026DED4C5|nr:thioredoxin family protein [Staphylococcus rostri]MDO5375296.1 thioredoxin family protein [Staphylococcus rostri]
MERITDYETLTTRMAQDKFVLYVMSKGCSVCHADLPRVSALLEDEAIPSAKIYANEIPEAAGQLSLFTAPVVILFDHGREFHRQARIIDFETLSYRLDQLKSA